MPETISFLDANGHVQDVSPSNPLPVTGGTGGGGGGSESNYALETGGNLAAVATNTAGLATAAAQTTGNNSLSSIATNTAAGATAANQATEITSLASIATNTAGLAKETGGNIAAIATNTAAGATASAQSTGNTSLATIATNTAGLATASAQTTGNNSLSSIATNTAAGATAANQATEISNQGTDNTGVSQPSSGTGIRGWLSAIYKQMIAGVSLSALSLSAVLASDQQVLPVNADPAQILSQPSSASMAALNATVQWTVEGGSAYLISLFNGPGATAQFVGTVTFQVSVNNGSSWASINGVPMSGPTAQNASTATAPGLWVLNPPNGASGQVLIRANMTAYTSGTVYADLASVGQVGGIITLPWTYTVTSGATLVGPLNVSGMSGWDIQISALTTTVLTAQGTNDPTLTTWDTLGVILANGSTAAAQTISAAGTYRIGLGGYKYARIQCTTTGTVNTVQGITARLGDPTIPGTIQNLAQIGGVVVSQATSQLGVNLANIGGSAVAVASAQLGINLVNMGGTAAAASIANGSTNKVLGATQATAVSQTDVNAGAFAGTGSVLGTVIASAQGGGGVVSAEINVSALTLGSATGVIMTLQESTGGANFTDIWCSDIITTTGIVRCPAIPVAGRRRWRAFSVGGASTTVTVTITTLELNTGYPILRQFRDLYAAATPFATMINSVAQTASNMVLATLGTYTTVFNIEGCKALSAFATFVGGTPTTAPVLAVMLSMDGTNWLNSGSTFTPTSAGVFGVSLSNNAWKYAKLQVTTAQAGGTNYTLGAVGINAVN